MRPASLALATVGFAVACTHRAPSSASASASAPAASLAASASTAPTVSAAPASTGPVPLPRTPLALVTGAPWTKGELRGARKVGHGTVLATLESPQRLVMNVDGGRGALFDVTSGKAIAHFPGLSAVSEKAGLASTSGARGSVVRLSDGAVVRVACIPANDKRAFVAVDPRQSRALALLSSTDGKPAVAVVASDGTCTPVPMPFAFVAADASGPASAFAREPDAWRIRPAGGHGEDRAGTPYFAKHDAACSAARVRGPSDVACVEYAPLLPSMRATWCEHDWYVTESDAWSADRHVWLGEAFGKTAPDSNGPPPAALSISPSPLRVLVQSLELESGKRRFAVWSPERTYTIEGPMPLIASTDAPPNGVTPILDEMSSAPRRDATEWLDLAQPKMFTTPPLEPLDVAPFIGVGERTLAADASGAVYVLDFAKGTRELVMAASGCSARLRRYDLGASDSERYLFFACVKPGPPNTVSETFEWGELVDTKTHALLRTKLRPVARFSDDTLVLGSERAVAAEMAASPGDVFVYRAP